MCKSPWKPKPVNITKRFGVWRAHQAAEDMHRAATQDPDASHDHSYIHLFFFSLVYPVLPKKEMQSRKRAKHERTESLIKTFFPIQQPGWFSLCERWSRLNKMLTYTSPFLIETLDCLCHFSTWARGQMKHMFTTIMRISFALKSWSTVKIRWWHGYLPTALNEK